MPAVPVNLITGALGAGKTTAIARLLASKPAAERWVVILNELTDAGIDALTLALSATGAYDVRAIPGGCLCCTGEEDFQQQLRGLLRDQAPARILIEPSGIAHPGAIIEELRDYERAGKVRLASTVALIDPPRIALLENGEGVERDQIDAADVLALSKAELAGDAERQRFLNAAQALFPAKRWVDFSERGELSSPVLEPPGARYSFQPPPRPVSHVWARSQVRLHTHPHADAAQARELTHRGRTIAARAQSLLGRAVCGWTAPVEIIFKRERLRAELAGQSLLNDVERFKAVLRTGIEQRLLVQRHLETVSESESAWRQDSRIEVQLKPGARPDWQAWDRFWLALME